MAGVIKARKPMAAAVCDPDPYRFPWGECTRYRQGKPVRSGKRTTSVIRRRSCSGGRPMTRPFPLRSARQADRMGSLNSHRASDRSLGYGRCRGMFWQYRRRPFDSRAQTGVSAGSWAQTGAEMPKRTLNRPHAPQMPRSDHQPHQRQVGRQSKRLPNHLTGIEGSFTDRFRMIYGGVGGR